MTKEYDVVIVGAGVTGTAIMYLLSKYTNVKNIAVIEKYHKVAQVNSRHNNNSQTLHFGDIETNYTIEKAEKVKKGADLVKIYLDTYDKSKKLHKKFSKMVLAVGDEQVEKLSKRYEKFKKLFPKLKKIGKEEIAKLEPKVVEGRDPEQKLLALQTEDGYTVDFGALAESFVEKAIKLNPKIDFFLNTKLNKIIKTEDGYEIITNRKTLKSKVVIISAGSHSLMIAQELGYGNNLALLPVAGSFYIAPNFLNGKVYTLQLKKLPFAAIHGDPEVGNPNITRFGPTAKVLPVLERRNPKTFWDFIKVSGLDPRAIIGLIKILSDIIIFKYVVRNFIYDIPFIGKRMFIKEVRKIVPTAKLNQLKFAKGYGGVRPQIVDKKTSKLNMGEAKLVGDNIIFNITPSPGASTCLQNAESDTEKIIEFLGKDYNFDKKKFEHDFK